MSVKYFSYYGNDIVDLRQILGDPSTLMSSFTIHQF